MAINNYRICFENAFDFADNLTAGADSMQNIGRADKFEWTSASPYLAFVGDFTDTPDINFFSLFGHNISETGTVKIILYDGAGQTGSTLLDTGFLDAWQFGSECFEGWQRYHSIFYFAATYNPASFAVYINDGVNDVEIVRTFTGRYIEPYYNVSYGLSLDFVDDSTHQRMRSGSLFSENNQQWRELSANSGFTTQEDMENYAKYFLSHGTFRDLIVSIYPETDNITEQIHTMNCKFKSFPRVVNDYYLSWATKLEFIEI